MAQDTVRTLQMKTGEGIYLTRVLKGTQSAQCHLTRPHHLHYLSTTWYLQYTRSAKLSILNFFERTASSSIKAIDTVALPDLL
jgi:hypothetical protein